MLIALRQKKPSHGLGDSSLWRSLIIGKIDKISINLVIGRYWQDFHSQTPEMPSYHAPEPATTSFVCDIQLLCWWAELLISQYFKLWTGKKHAHKKYCVLGPPKCSRRDTHRKCRAVWMRLVYCRWGQPRNVCEGTLQHQLRGEWLFPGTDAFSYVGLTSCPAQSRVSSDSLRWRHEVMCMHFNQIWSDTSPCVCSLS